MVLGFIAWVGVGLDYQNRRANILKYRSRDEAPGHLKDQGNRELFLYCFSIS